MNNQFIYIVSFSARAGFKKINVLRRLLLAYDHSKPKRLFLQKPFIQNWLTLQHWQNLLNIELN